MTIRVCWDCALRRADLESARRCPWSADAGLEADIDPRGIKLRAVTVVVTSDRHLRRVRPRLGRLGASANALSTTLGLEATRRRESACSRFRDAPFTRSVRAQQRNANVMGMRLNRALRRRLETRSACTGCDAEGVPWGTDAIDQRYACAIAASTSLCRPARAIREPPIAQ